MYIFARLLIAHLLSDIPLNLFGSEKRNGSLPYRLLVLGLHTVIVFLTTLLFFVDKLNQTVFLCILIVSSFHFLIDALRLWLEKRIYPESGVKPTPSKRRDLARLFRFARDPRASWSEPRFRWWFLLNVFDQCLHLLILVLVASYLVRVL